MSNEHERKKKRSCLSFVQLMHRYSSQCVNATNRIEHMPRSMALLWEVNFEKNDYFLSFWIHGIMLGIWESRTRVNHGQRQRRRRQRVRKRKETSGETNGGDKSRRQKWIYVRVSFQRSPAIGNLRKCFKLLLVFPFELVCSRHFTQSNHIETQNKKNFNGGQMCQILTHSIRTRLHNHFSPFQFSRWVFT